MNLTPVARALLASPSFANPRVLHEQLGGEAYREALRLGWLQPEPETGAVTVSTRLDHHRAMQEAATLTADERQAAATTDTAMADPTRGFYGEQTVTPTLVMREAVDPTNDPEKPAEIGDQVTVAEGGQTYQARVQAKNQDGTVKLSFGATKPNRDVFKPEEVRVVGRAPREPATASGTATLPPTKL
jgi:hypothetical protein